MAIDVKSLPTSPITFEEFLEWCDEDTRAEWVNGRVVLMSPVSDPHERIQQFLCRVLYDYTDARGLGRAMSPFLMRLRKIQIAREPDVLFISHERASRISRTYIDGVADLVVEVVSPDSVERDRVEKLHDYAVAGVREYWIVDPDRKTAEFYELGSDGRYLPIEVAADGIFHSRVVDGFFLRLEWLWRTPPPRTPDVLRELGVL